MQLQSGIYTMDVVTVNASETLEGVGRVIITRADGKPPSVEIGVGATLKNVWIGGTRETALENSAHIHPATNAVLDGGTFFGYYGGVNCGDSYGQCLKNCRFVNCGTQLLYHPLYVNQFRAQAGEGVLIQDNVFVGCEGYSIHLYHSPNYCTLLRNFIAANGHGIAIEGNYNAAKYNIIWQNYTASCAWLGQDNGTSNLTFRQNLFGYATTTHWLDYPADSKVGKNYFVEGATPFGNNPITIQRSMVGYYTGYTSVQLNQAVNNIKTSFNAPLINLLADTSIESNFAVCKLATLNWSVNA